MNNLWEVVFGVQSDWLGKSSLLPWPRTPLCGHLHPITALSLDVDLDLCLSASASGITLLHSLRKGCIRARLDGFFSDIFPRSLSANILPCSPTRPSRRPRPTARSFSQEPAVSFHIVQEATDTTASVNSVDLDEITSITAPPASGENNQGSVDDEGEIVHVESTSEVLDNEPRKSTSENANPTGDSGATDDIKEEIVNVESSEVLSVSTDAGSKRNSTSSQESATSPQATPNDAQVNAKLARERARQTLRESASEEKEEKQPEGIESPDSAVDEPFGCVVPVPAPLFPHSVIHEI